MLKGTLKLLKPRSDLHLGGVCVKDDELVTAQAKYDALVREAALDFLPALHNDMVSDKVSVAVVDLLEMIPVKEQERAHLIGVCCHIFIDPLFTASSVQKSGDCVFFGQSGQMGYQFFMFHKRPPFRNSAWTGVRVWIVLPCGSKVHAFHRVYHRFRIW